VAATAASAAYQHGKTTLANKKPPPPPVPKRLGVKMVVALYDYDAQQDGDLSFRKDDRIEIVERTASTEDWWTGKLNGRQGVFPGKLSLCVAIFPSWKQHLFWDLHLTYCYVRFIYFRQLCPGYLELIKCEERRALGEHV
jgi:hypothetical protein